MTCVFLSLPSRNNHFPWNAIDNSLRRALGLAVTNGSITTGPNLRPPKMLWLSVCFLLCVYVPRSVVYKKSLRLLPSRATQKGNISSFGRGLELIKCNKCLFSDDNCWKGFSSTLLGRKGRDYLSLARTIERVHTIKISSLPTWSTEIIARNNNKSEGIKVQCWAFSRLHKLRTFLDERLCTAQCLQEARLSGF